MEIEIIQKIDLESVCRECGQSIDGSYDRRREKLFIEPCEHCIKQLKNEIRELESKLENYESNLNLP